jgi:uncharacterized membrane protein YraQ (UPF0718 family)/copper chaperone CopZ
MDHIIGILNESWVLLAKMAPYLLLGVVVAGTMHVILPEGLIARYLGAPGLGSVVRSTALGVPLPLCSCGVVPVAASLKKEGASSGAVVGFLVSTPTSGVDSILATYALIGGAYAVIRVIGSFVLGIAAGVAASFGAKDGETVTPPATPAPEDGKRGNPVVDGLAYGFGDMLGAIARPLALGILLGGAITYFVPASFVTKYVGTGIWSYLVMLAVGLPLYVCASGSIPLAAAFIALGISPGAALIFLIVGPATNAATFTVVLEMLGKRVLIIYLAVISLGALAMGAATDVFFATFPSLLPAIATSGKHHAGGLGWLEISTAVVLGVTTLYHLGREVKAVIDRRQKPADDAFVLRVPDMTCQHCAGTIRKAVTDLPGVREINADPGTKLVTLDLGQEADPNGLIQAIGEAGFHPEKA